jgi:predicted esterase
MTLDRSIPTSMHGHYLVEVPDSPGPFPLLAGFHGYAENASVQLERMRTIPGSSRCLMVAVQGLHRFYRQSNRDVIASWMTRQDRDLMIADNIAYVSAVVEAVSGEWKLSGPIVLVGFSQGVATAFRFACRGSRPVSGVIALGGDVPPELEPSALARIPWVLIGRGDRDDWYTSEQCTTDGNRLMAAGVQLDMCRFNGGHEWTNDFTRAVGNVIARLW